MEHIVLSNTLNQYYYWSLDRWYTATFRSLLFEDRIMKFRESLLSHPAFTSTLFPTKKTTFAYYFYE